MEHHAYIYEGERSELPFLLEDARSRFNFKNYAHSDIYMREFDKFTIEDARSWRVHAALKSTTTRSFFILACGSMTTEAQQALLKFAEEPQRGMTFVLLAPLGTLLPTLRSRFLPYPARSAQGKSQAKEAVSFLHGAYKERSAYILELLDDEEGLRERVRQFLSSLEEGLYPSITKRRDIREGLQDVISTRSYLSDRSAAVKMMLEHLAVSLPRLS